MLELCALGPVRRHRRPVVGPGPVAPPAQVDHGLDREDVPGLHDANCFVFRIMGHVRRRVEQFADPMAAVGLDYLTTSFLGDALCAS